MFKWLLGRKTEEIYWCKQHEAIDCLTCPKSKQEVIGWIEDEEETKDI
jgi:hypothetical protein